MPKIYMYPASEAPIVVLLNRGSCRTEYEMIEWNTDTDTFRRGQWIRYASLHPPMNHVSPDGKHFGYAYDRFYRGKHPQQEKQSASVIVVSRVPNFTAELLTLNGCYDYNYVFFTDNEHVVSFEPLEKKNPESTLISTTGGLQPAPQLCEEFTDSRGRQIRTEGHQIVADGEVIYDTSDHVFECKAPL